MTAISDRSVGVHLDHKTPTCCRSRCTATRPMLWSTQRIRARASWSMRLRRVNGIRCIRVTVAMAASIGLNGARTGTSRVCLPRLSIHSWFLNVTFGHPQSALSRHCQESAMSQRGLCVGQPAHVGATVVAPGVGYVSVVSKISNLARIDSIADGRLS